MPHHQLHIRTNIPRDTSTSFNNPEPLLGTKESIVIPNKLEPPAFLSGNTNTSCSCGNVLYRRGRRGGGKGGGQGEG